MSPIPSKLHQKSTPPKTSLPPAAPFSNSGTTHCRTPKALIDSFPSHTRSIHANAKWLQFYLLRLRSHPFLSLFTSTHILGLGPTQFLEYSSPLRDSSLPSTSAPSNLSNPLSLHWKSMSHSCCWKLFSGYPLSVKFFQDMASIATIHSSHFWIDSHI